MDNESLKQQKNFLKSAQTKVTAIDGKIHFEKSGEIVGSSQQQTFGFVVDNSPDTVANEIISNLYLGSQDCVTNKVYLHSLGIKHILCVAPLIPSLFPNEFDYKNIELLDLPSFNIKLLMNECIDYIDLCLNQGEAVICHCNAGVSRSATVVIAYLILKKKMSFTKAYNLVKQKRPSIRPNDGFLIYLKMLDQQNLIQKE
ncbi:hypothetical protein ENUP19_0274G0007 [Entamoeba nuttalli]|uniref:Dual specificity protein phosphatase, putative n=2 Tax=Entamoeba nuttalli TaxID=412467 RepID=K2H941_ENTNP|nr:dual specificity protein phosphatase, putative [Entamoeba nuttalli P19]EKE39089.1 dual specificity protein phosphatase, putative [Entamoeba nuttalli P19]|eukprot:XP_008858584.1 dual specificity protein phosphatase, putative [Entamoeba nuttalli P19]